MRVCITALTVLALAAMGSAAPPNFYLGGSVHVGAIAETLSPMPPGGEGTVSDPQSYGTRGGSLESGWVGSFWDVHLGARFNYAWDRERVRRDLGDEISCFNSSHDWYDFRLSLGSRLHVSDRVGTLIRPTVGAGITYGWLTRSHSYRQWSVIEGAERFVSTESEERHYPGGSFGWLLEMGMQVVPVGPVRYSRLVRFENYQLRSDRDPNAYHAFDGANQISAELGVFYTFAKLSESH